ncbi:MAG TPA: hypothetical protein DCP73_06870 [Chloroflexi bacterium]|nr:hypothetical protein [Chloroflexota bacterium]
MGNASRDVLTVEAPVKANARSVVKHGTIKSYTGDRSQLTKVGKVWKLGNIYRTEACVCDRCHHRVRRLEFDGLEHS